MGLSIYLTNLYQFLNIPIFANESIWSDRVQRFRGGLVFEAHRLCVSLNSRLEINKEEKKSLTVTAGTRRGKSAPWRGAS